MIVSGIILKKTRAFARGNRRRLSWNCRPTTPRWRPNILRATWERGWSFIRRAGTVIVAASMVIWVLNSLTLEGGLHYIQGEETSILNLLGSGLAVLFAPLGFGRWQAAVATGPGLVAKEEVVGVFGALSSMEDADLAMAMVEAGDTAGLAVIGQEFFGGSRPGGLLLYDLQPFCALPALPLWALSGGR